MTGAERAPGAKSVLDRHFDEHAPYWREIYSSEGLQGLIYRQRMQLALDWIGELGPVPGAAALEVGSGAGLLSAELARRGFEVTSTDASDEMTALTARHAAREGVSAAVRVQVADAHELRFESAAFELVVALGVLPWLADPRRAVAEMAQVLRPGGLLVLSADNRWRLNSLVGQNPVLEPLKGAYRAIAPGRFGEPEVRSRMHSPRVVNRLLMAAGAYPVRWGTIGFGPLEFAGRPLLSKSAALRTHARLQSLSDRGNPLIKWLGWHYMVAARKPSPGQTGAH